jgi:hypothetical protein
MKMKSEDYAQLEQAIQKVQSDQPEVTVERYAARGESAERYRWDALHSAIYKGYFPRLHSSEGGLYSYCNDDNIDTALRRITGTK